MDTENMDTIIQEAVVRGQVRDPINHDIFVHVESPVQCYRAK